MSGLMKAPRYLWDRMRTLRRICRRTFKVGLIIFVCLAVVYSIGRVVLFGVYESKLAREMARFEAAGGSTNISTLIPPSGGRAPRLIMAAGLLVEEPGLLEPAPPDTPTLEEAERAAKETEAWEAYGSWPGDNFYRTTRDASNASLEWDDAWTGVLEDYIETNAVAITLAKEAARIGEGGFEVDWRAGYDADLKHLARVRSCARLLMHDVTAAAARGEVDSAAENVRLGFRLSALIANEPFIISRLVTYACDAISCRSLQGVLEFGTPEAGRLRALLAELDGREDFYVLTGAFMTETAFGLNVFDRIGPDPTYIDTIGSSERLRYRRQPWFANALTGLGIKLVWVEPSDRYHYLRTMNTYIEASQKAFPEKLDVPEEKFQRRWQDAPFKVLTMMLTPSLSKMALQEAAAATRVRLARSVLALTLYRLDHGSYPDTLEQLVPAYLSELQIDPFDGKPLRYQPRGRGFVVYSVGSDRIDDGGVYDDPYGEEGDITWER